MTGNKKGALTDKSPKTKYRLESMDVNSEKYERTFYSNHKDPKGGGLYEF
jgi:hypothetical protein